MKASTSPQNCSLFAKFVLSFSPQSHSSSSSKISDIYITLDTHNPSHIAHAMCWKDAGGADPPPFTVISHRDVVCGRWVPKDPEQLVI